MPGSEPPVGAALRRDELPDGYFTARAEKVRDRAAEGRAGILVPNIGRAATSGSIRQDQRAHRQVLEKVL